MISFPSRGALSTLSFEVEQELTEEDLLVLKDMPANSPPVLQKITARHRRTAMMVAQGKQNEVVAEALGYTPTRVGQLRQDPAFQELVAYYEDQIHEESLGDERRFQEKLRAAGEQAIDLINERLEDPELARRVSTSELRQIATVAADRTVAPPKAIQGQSAPPSQITLNFGRELKPQGGKEKPEPKIINPDGEEIKDV